MSLISYLILFGYGLAVGSFLNVISFRYIPGAKLFALKPLRGRSHCLYCKKKLTWYELIPLVSFIIQKATCRACKKILSWQYPIVELLSGAIFVAVPYYFQQFFGITLVTTAWTHPSFFIFIILMSIWIFILLILLLMSVIDFRHYLIPDELTITLGVLGIAFAITKFAGSSFVVPFRNSFLKNYQIIFSPFESIWSHHLAGAIIGGLLFGVLFYFGRGKAMGMGDVKLAITSGLALGFPDIILTAMFAFIYGGIAGVFMLVKKHKTLKDKLAFGPFFGLGIITTVFFGHTIISQYFSLFSI